MPGNKRLVLAWAFRIFTRARNDENMKIRTQVFSFVAGFLLLANLLVTNDFTTLWAGAESLLAWRSLSGEAGSTPHELLLAWIMGNGPVPHFWLRLPGALVFILALGGYWALARKLFGTELLVVALMVMGASLLMPNLAKVATGDTWAMATQWLAFGALIRFLKQPVLAWRAVFYGLLFLAVWIQPANALIFLLGSSAFLYFLHPQGRRLWSLNPWLAGLAFFLLLYYAGAATFIQAGFLVGFRTGRFLLWNLIGILPFLGFVLAGLWETARRLGRREEMALLNAAGIIFALAGHSLALQGLLAFVAARQLKNYFDPNYPHRPIVKAGALLHLVAAFCVLTPLMIGGFFQFRGAGFRAMLAAGGIYWMMSFVAVIGLFGPSRRYLYGGAILSGLLLCTLFWLQVNPLIQQKLDWPGELVQKSLVSNAGAGSGRAFLMHRDGEPFPPLAPYCRAGYPETQILNTAESLGGSWERAGAAVFFLKRSDAESLGARSPADTIKGWGSRLRPVEYVLLVKK